jgi:hypothetical protein
VFEAVRPPLRRRRLGGSQRRAVRRSDPRGAVCADPRYLQDGCITHNDGVKVDSFFGFVTERWHPALSVADIPTPQGRLRIVLRDGAAGPTGSDKKRGMETVDGAAGPTDAKRPKCTHGRLRNLCKDCGGGSICTHGLEPARDLRINWVDCR